MSKLFSCLSHMVTNIISSSKVGAIILDYAIRITSLVELSILSSFLYDILLAISFQLTIISHLFGTIFALPATAIEFIACNIVTFIRSK